jgi:hypothetical protein
MAWKRKVQGGGLAFIGFLLSPLSWWNDAFVNLPLAVGFGWLVSLIYGPAFAPAVIVGYWLTNVLGFVLMHKGTEKVLANNKPETYSGRKFIKDLLVSLAYTLLIAVLIKLRILQPIANYFTKK